MTATTQPPQPVAGASAPKISRLIRRVHMFAGLFLAPWMLMYALSTLVMTHQKLVQSLYTSQVPPMTKERQLDYSRSFPPTATREEIAQQILRDVGLDGTHSLTGGKDGKPLVILRQRVLANRRVTFDPSSSKLIIENEEPRVPYFLGRMHRRRGYDKPYVADDAWGFAVDVAAVVMAFWSLSGIWLWWELKSTRYWGTLSLGGGLALFAIFLSLL